MFRIFGLQTKFVWLLWRPIPMDRSLCFPSYISPLEHPRRQRSVHREIESHHQTPSHHRPPGSPEVGSDKSYDFPKKNILPWIGQIIIFHQSRFPRKSGDFSKPQLHFGALGLVRSLFYWTSLDVNPLSLTLSGHCKSWLFKLETSSPQKRPQTTQNGVFFSMSPKSKKLLLDESKLRTFRKTLGELYMDVSENRGTPKSSILTRFSTLNHPFWGTPIYTYSI